jgi:hypothetical protein
MTAKDDRELRQIVYSRVIRLNTMVLATAMGLVAGFALFAATIFLLLKGGENVGAHLALLSQFFPGYNVSWGGAVVGFGYAFGVTWLISCIGATLYNVVVDMRNRRAEQPKHS